MKGRGLLLQRTGGSESDLEVVWRYNYTSASEREHLSFTFSGSELVHKRLFKQVTK